MEDSESEACAHPGGMGGVGVRGSAGGTGAAGCGSAECEGGKGGKLDANDPELTCALVAMASSDCAEGAARMGVTWASVDMVPLSCT